MNMPPSKGKPRKPGDRKNSTLRLEKDVSKEPPTKELTGNEESNKDIFTDIESNRSTNLVVTEHKSFTSVIPQQQVASNRVRDDECNNSNHAVVVIEQEAPTSQQHIQMAQENQVSHETHSRSVDSSSNYDDDVFDEAAMSATLTRLTSPNGAEIYLIGTAHFSTQSVQDVRKVIRSIKPTSVILELCRERAFMLTLDEQHLFDENSKLTVSRIRQAIGEKGLVHGLIFVLFIQMSSALTKKLGMAPGAEFRAGSAEAQKIQGCHVVLADRSLRTTISRAVSALSLWQKMKLAYMVLRSDLSITQNEVEMCKDKNILEPLMVDLGVSFPGFKNVLVDERDIYLSHSIFRWAQNCETSQGPPRIVAIMGIGHVPGIVANWGKTSDEQVRSLSIIPEASRTEKVVGKTVKYGLVALALYVGYCCLAPTSLQNAINHKVFGTR